MTGFGSADGRVGGAEVSVELRTVNHRFFNPAFKLPAAFARWEGELRDALRQRVARGHLTVSVRVVREQADSLVGVDEARFAAWVTELRALKERHGLGGDLDVATVLRMPDVMSGAAREVELDPGTAPELVAVVEQAAAALTAMREAEGRRLADFLLERVDTIEQALGRVAARSPKRLVEQRDRLRQGVRELLDGVAGDEQRIAQEIAVLADRLDVSEELDRFAAHVAAFRATLATPPADGVGKRLGFLVQEMLREANTTGSKGADAAIVAEVVSIKEELERIREQVENLE